MGIHTSGKKVKHQILSRMTKLHIANATISRPSSFLADQVKYTLTSSAEHSVESIKEWRSDEQETTEASRDRLQDLPEWFEEFTKKSWNQNQPPRPDPPPAKAPKGTHSSFTHFPKDPKNVKYANVRKLREQIADGYQKVTQPARPSSEKSLQPITESSMKKENRGRDKGMQLLCKNWPLNGFKAFHARQKKLHKKQREIWRTFVDPEEHPKVIHRQFIGIWKSL